MSDDETCQMVAKVMGQDSGLLPEGYAWRRYVCSECGHGMSPGDEACKGCGRRVEGVRYE